MTAGNGSGVHTRKSSPKRQFPAHALEEAIAIVRAIADMNAGRPMDRLLLAKALQRSPSSSDFRWLLSSSYKYGLTEGTEKADFIAPTSLGLQITKPTNEAERIAAVRRAALTPELLSRIMQHFNRSKLPQGGFFQNTLERTFSVPPEHSAELSELIVENARFAGLLEEIQGNLYIRLDGASAPPIPAAEQPNEEDLEEESQVKPEVEESIQQSRAPSSSTPSRPRQIFVAHGKNKQPLEELRRILDEFKIPYKVAVAEPHAGRPISQKVAELMNSCSAAIFVFTKDEEFVRDGETIWRPSENVVYELGAASVLYGTKIIIFKEDGIRFASDFQDLGYITFRAGELSTKALELLRELVALNFVRLEAA